MKELLLAIDVGTSRVRASLRRPDGTVVQIRSRGVSSGETLASQLWSTVVTVVRDLDNREHVVAVGVAAMLGTVLLDGSGEPAAPLLPWSDTSAELQASQLRAVLGAEGARRAGRPISAELPIAKLARIRAERPSEWRRVRHVLSVKDYLVLRLTGSIVTDWTHASYSGLFNVRAGRYDDALTEAAGVSTSMLPAVDDAAAIAGDLTEEARRELGVGQSSRVQVAVGGPDGSVGTLAAGAVRAGVTVDVTGTTDVLLSTVASPPEGVPITAVFNRHVVSGLWTLGGPMGLTGGAVTWASRLLGFESVTEAVAAAASVSARVPPPLFSPALSGSRFPVWSAAERAGFGALDSEHDRSHLMRGVIDGVSMSVREGLELIRNSGVAIDEVQIVGTLATDMRALRMRSNALGLAVRATEDPEPTLLGVPGHEVGPLVGIVNGEDLRA